MTTATLIVPAALNRLHVIEVNAHRLRAAYLAAAGQNVVRSTSFRMTQERGAPGGRPGRAGPARRMSRHRFRKARSPRGFQRRAGSQTVTEDV
jgi:hypothetical protein